MFSHVHHRTLQQHSCPLLMTYSSSRDRVEKWLLCSPSTKAKPRSQSLPLPMRALHHAHANRVFPADRGKSRSNESGNVPPLCLGKSKHLSSSLAVLSNSDPRSCRTLPRHTIRHKSDMTKQKKIHRTNTSQSKKFPESPSNMASSIHQNSLPTSHISSTMSMDRNRSSDEGTLMAGESTSKRGHQVSPPLTRAARAVYSVSDGVVLNLDHGSNAPSSGEERCRSCGESLRRLLRNDPELGQRTRWVANLLSVTIRVGLNTFFATAIRQFLQYQIEKSLGHDAGVDTTRLALATIFLLSGLGLNLTGAIRDEYRGTATRGSRMARSAMATGSLVCLAGGLSSELGRETLRSFAALGASFNIYTVGRDIGNSIVGMPDNISELRFVPSFIAGVVYSIEQFVFSSLQMRLGPNSGAGAIQNGVDNHAFLDDLVRSLINAGVEISDDFVRSTLLSRAEARQALDDHESGLVIRVEPPRIPSSPRFFNQMLVTCAVRTTIFPVVIFLGEFALSLLDKLFPNAISGNMKGYVSLAVSCAMILLLYPAFVFAHQQAPTRSRNPGHLQVRTPELHERW